MPLPKLCSLLAPCLATCLATSSALAQAKFEPPGEGVYHGASLRGVWDDSLSRELDSYAKVAGKRVSVVTWFASYYDQGRVSSWKQNYLPNLYRVQKLGAISLIKFSTQAPDYAASGQIAKTSDIAAGKYDSYFGEFADTIKLFGEPVLISIDHEMNGNWYPYSEGYAGPKPAGAKASDFVAAWRHIVEVFRKKGVDNAAWVWSVNVPEVDAVPAAKYYPGDEYVDWVGASFYSGNRIENMRPFYVAYAPRKPIFITEWATAPEKTRYYSGPYPGDAAWVRTFFKNIEANYPRVKGISWFNLSQADGNYLLARDTEQAQSYSAAVQKPRYLAQAAPRAGTAEPDRPPLIPDGRETVATEAPRAARPPRQRITIEAVKTEKVRIQR